MSFIISEYGLIATENGIILNPTIVISLLIGCLLFIIFVIWFIIKNRAIKESEPFFIPIGRTGQITDLLPNTYQGSPLYQIKVAGEIWQARSTEGLLNINDEVEIISQEKNLLILNVKKRGST